MVGLKTGASSEVPNYFSVESSVGWRTQISPRRRSSVVAYNLWTPGRSLRCGKETAESIVRWCRRYLWIGRRNERRFRHRYEQHPNVIAIHEYKLIFPKSFEPVGRKRSVARSVLDIAVAEISLQRARIDAVICQLVTAGVAQHMRVRFDA